MERKNQVLMTVLGVFALVVVTIGVSYAFFTYTRTGTTQTTLKTSGGLTQGTITFIYSEGDNVTLSNAYPTTVEVGKKLTNHYEFDVTGNITGADKATALGYDIIAVNSSAAGNQEEVLSNNRVRAYLTKLSSDQVESPVFNTSDQTVLMSDIINGTTGGEGLLYSDSLQFPANNTESDTNKGQTQRYRLRIWLDEANSSDLGGESSINITDNGTGVIPSPSEPDNGKYTVTEDNKGVTVTNSAGQKTTYVYSLKIKVVAREVTNVDNLDVTHPGTP